MCTRIRHRSTGALVAGLFLAVSTLGCARTDAQESAGEWRYPGNDQSLTRFSELDQINTQNAGDLELAWSFSTGTLRGHEGQPLVIGNTMYFVTPYPNYVWALDLTRDGSYEVKWKYEPEVDPDAVGVACCDVVNRGVAYSDGKIFVNTLDAHTLALNAETGELIWREQQGDVKQGETITNTPIVIGNKVITGVSGGEFGVRGFLTANDVNTGERIWRVYNTGPDSEVKLCSDFDAPYYSDGEEKNLAVKTWEGDQWQIGGATVWGWFSYDPELDLLYYGTSNPGTWNPDMRPGDNKWSTSLMARDPDDGCLKWAYQMTPHDAWDYDGVNENVLVDLQIEGQERGTLVHFDRNGFAYVLDRTSGEVLRADPYGPVNWAERIDLETGRPVEDPAKRTRQGVNTTDICPSAMGFKDQQPTSYSPQTGWFYVPRNNLCMDYEGVEVSYTAGLPYVGAIVKSYAGPGGYRGEFLAWDPVKGEKVWGIEEDFPVWSGTLVTAGDIAFYGTMDGRLKVVNATSGEVLWSKRLGSGFIGAPMTYTGPDGKQYVAILSGVGGWAGLTVAGDLSLQDKTGALGAVNMSDDLPRVTAKGGMLFVFSLGD